MELAFAHLNLRRNPFGLVPPARWPELACAVGPDLDELAARLKEPGSAVLYLGEQGRGKSTHLRALHGAHFPQAPFLYIGEGERPPLPRGQVVFIDELQRVSRWRRALLFRRRRASFAIGSHVDHTAEMRRAGLEVVRVELEGLDRDRLRQIVEARLAWARRGPGPVPWLTDEALDALIERFGDNLRAIEHDLYERFQRLEAVGPVEVGC